MFTVIIPSSNVRGLKPFGNGEKEGDSLWFMVHGLKPKTNNQPPTAHHPNPSIKTISSRRCGSGFDFVCSLEHPVRQANSI
jgi:hypothetical protein